MKKERLKDKLIALQQQRLALSQEIEAQNKQFHEQQDKLFLDLVGLLDSFENIFNAMQAHEATLDKSAKRALKSFRGFYRKLLRTLEESGIERIEFADGKAEIGLCKIIDTQALPDAEEGTVLSVIRHGYRRGDRILRPAEVITVAKPGIRDQESGIRTTRSDPCCLIPDP